MTKAAASADTSAVDISVSLATALHKVRAACRLFSAHDVGYPDPDATLDRVRLDLATVLPGAQGGIVHAESSGCLLGR